MLPINVANPNIKNTNPRTLNEFFERKMYSFFVFLVKPLILECKHLHIIPFDFRTYQTNRGSINCITITNPRVTSIKPKLSSNIRQQTPFTFGQNGFGADIASIRAPARRDRLLRPVFAELATEYKLRGPFAFERCV